MAVQWIQALAPVQLQPLDRLHQSSDTGTGRVQQTGQQLTLNQRQIGQQQGQLRRTGAGPRLPAAGMAIGDRTEALAAFRPGYRRQLLLQALDRKSTRLNSSHVKISYAVFCLKKKTKST